MKKLNTDVRAALLAAALLATAPALYAQSNEEPLSEPAPPANAAEQTTPEPATADPSNTTATATPVADAKIDQFATAYIEIQAIQSKASEELNSTSDTTKADAVKAQAEGEMIKAVQQSGLQVDEFNQIAQLMTSDEGLRSRVIERLQQKSGG
jgi:hypothetical protein